MKELVLLVDAGNLGILWITLGAIGVALIVFLLYKFVPGLKIEKTEKSEKEEADDNLNRMLVPFDPDEKKDENDDEEENDKDE